MPASGSHEEYIFVCLTSPYLPQSVPFCYSCQTWLTHAHYTLKSVILWPTPGYHHIWQDLETWFLGMLFSNPGCTLWRPITILLAHARSLTTSVRQVLYRCDSQETQEELACQRASTALWLLWNFESVKRNSTQSPWSPGQEFLK